MTQMSLVEEGSVPWSLTMTITTSPVHPEVTLIDIRTLSKFAEILASYGCRLTGTECDYIPSMAQCAIEGYLYGAGSDAATKAARRMREEARKSRKLWLIRRMEQGEL